MAKMLVEQLAEFTSDTRFSHLPAEVIEESKRILLDTLGCALGGTTEPKGRIGVEHAQVIGGGSTEATIIGSRRRSSSVGAAFANAELVQALDFDAILPPGHVSPYVVPGLLAIGEASRAPGTSVIEAMALSHEMSYRFGKAMDYTRDVNEDGTMSFAPVLGYASTVFGATAAVGKLRGTDPDVLAGALGIAASISPVNSHGSWMSHAPSSTIKYTMAGALAQSALTAASAAELGHRGDKEVLDDAERGYRRFIATNRWEPSAITGELGTTWRFPAESTFKPYPHCRVLHALLDALIDLLGDNDIKPEEIEAIHAWGEAWIEQPVWLNNTIEHVHDAQFSIAHGLAVGAHRVPPGRAWQDPDLVFSRSVLDLMDRVSFAPHPDYAQAIKQHPSSRPSRVEVVARGTTFVADRSFPKGSPSPDPSTRMTDAELVAKFHVNAEGVISSSRATEVAQAILALEDVPDFTQIMSGLVPQATQITEDGPR